MWKVIKSEICYRANTLIWVVLSSLAIYFLINSNWIFTKTVQRQFNLGLVFLIYMLIVFAVSLILKAWSKENRDRQLILLPISLRFIGLIRIFLDIVLWLILFGLFLIFALISDHFRLNLPVWYLLAMATGCVLVVISMAFFWRDLVIPVKNRNSNLLIDRILSLAMNFLIPGFFYILGLMLLMLIIQGLKHEKSVLTQAFINPAVALAVLLTGILLVVSSIIFFEKRTSYLK